VHRHFRAGKRRLIELLLQHSSQNLAGLESDLQALISERHTQPHVAPAPARQTAPRQAAPPPNRRPHRPHEPESTDPGVSLAAWLEGLGVPTQPCTGSLAGRSAGRTAETDGLSVPTGSGKTYVAGSARRDGREPTVIYTSPLKALEYEFTEFSKIRQRPRRAF
jgi:hypothetical protein